MEDKWLLLAEVISDPGTIGGLRIPLSLETFLSLYIYFSMVWFLNTTDAQKNGNPLDLFPMQQYPMGFSQVILTADNVSLMPSL
jgi:hypothetical protein